MTATGFRRPPRLPAPDVPLEGVPVPAPPRLARPESGGGWLTALPALSGLGSVAYLFAGPGGPIAYVTGSLVLFSSLAMVGGGALRGRTSTRTAADRSRADYLRALARARTQARDVAAAQRRRALWLGPAPDQLWTITTGRRLWERRRSDPDAGLLRIGVGAGTLAVPLDVEDPDPVEEPDPLAATAHRRFVTTHRLVPGTPRLLPTRELGCVRLTGPMDETRALCRAMVLQAIAFHAPADLRVAVCTADPDGGPWGWVKWLPHAQLVDTHDAVGPARALTSDLAALEELLGAELAGRARRDGSASPDLPQLLVVLDGGHVDGGELLLAADGLQAVTVLDLDGAARELAEAHGTTLAVANGRLTRDGDGADPAEEPRTLGIADVAPVPLAESLARPLVALRIDDGDDPDDATAADVTLPGLLGIPGPDRVDVARLRRPRPARDRLRTPIGPAVGGGVLELDIKEAAQGGMGPHGLVVGATGSGKSELLRTLVLGMTAVHGSDELNLVLVDFKGGATFAGLGRLPHVAAVITNLADDLSLVDRMREALSGELTRRQELLRTAGGLTSLREYDEAREQGAPLAPLPTLWVVVDEFSELLTQKPEFAELFVQIGRLGRSLGVHLLLASQRIDEGRLRGLESHLSYRIGLRTFSESESRAVLGVPDAYGLPTTPGHGYLKSESAQLRRFRAAYVSGSWTRGAEAGGGPEAVAVRPFTASPQPLPTAQPSSDDRPSGRPSVLDALVQRLAGVGAAAHRVWLPPLDAPDTLDRLVPDLRVRPGRGLGSDPSTPALTVAVGTVDLPFRQRREPLVLDLGGAAGNVAIVGGPRAGKSTLARTLVAALALRHTPAEVQVHCLDLGGGSLFGLAGLPHVGTVAGRQDADLVRRTVAEVAELVRDREARFRAAGIDSMAAYRQARADGRVLDAYGDVVLVVDGWAVLHQEFEDVEAQLTALAGRALAYGVHLVLTANRWLDLRMGLRDVLGGKLELKLGDALDSETDRRAQQDVPVGRPGRGVTAERMHYLAALPRIDGVGSPDDLADGVAALVDAVAGAWSGPGVAPVRLLPARVELDELPPDPERRIVYGVEGLHLEPVVLDARHEQALVVLGDSGSGRTSLIRTVAAQVLARPPTAAKIVLIDYRRTLLGEFDGPGVLSYAATAQQAVDAVAGLVEGFTRRLPGPDVTPEQLRSRTWWSGPEIHLLVDDHDLVTAGTNPLAPLADLLPHARDIGLRLVIARRAGGAGRALGDPVVGRLRELGQPVVVLSAAPDEGSLYGVLPRPLPPGRGTLVSRRAGTVPIQLVTGGRPGGEVTIR